MRQNTVVTNYYLPAKFSGEPNTEKLLLLDIDRISTFVLHHQSFPDLPAKSTVDFEKSTSFKNTTKKFFALVSSDTNDEIAFGDGHVCEDTFEILGNKIHHAFGVVNKGDPALTLASDGTTAAGRIGFARNTSYYDEKDVRFELFKNLRENVLCFGTTYSEVTQQHISKVALGQTIYPEKDFVASAHAYTYDEHDDLKEDGIWRIQTDTISIGNYTKKRETDTVFTSTKDGLVFHFYDLYPIMRSLKAVQNTTDKEWYTDCSNDIPLSIGINRKLIKIRFDAFTEQVGDGKCRIKIKSHVDDYIIIGLPFFVNNGVCLNYKINRFYVYDITNPGIVAAGVQDNKDNIIYTRVY
ncbi:unnamed protein product [Bursaphelenchus okinawaensis]|uniref:Peptidase A1 domain-containing protein n=1 Tax=Bursaphelenchus okinawaensis TaxID=465554 RepID=A0A811KEN4_9BILA|nr:unnamed protein product [Bursaphelenchus okinawaensis]CAG9102295.1 unnamed protein product [Bursaphelenchus okinawaensis]